MSTQSTGQTVKGNLEVIDGDSLAGGADNDVLDLISNINADATTQDVNYFLKHYALITTDSTPEAMASVPIGSSRAYLFEARVVVHNHTDSQGCVYIVRAAVQRWGGAAALIGADDMVFEREDAGSAACDVELVLNGNDLEVKVTGINGKDIYWHCTLTFQYV